MPSRLVACPACVRHVRVSEPRCPFCAAALPPDLALRAAPVPPPRGLSRSALFRYGTVATAGAALGTITFALTGGLFASACTETLAQIDDGGMFPQYDGDHPPAAMYGAPCGFNTDPPERCCGVVAKAISGPDCYGCTGTVAYAICTGSAFSCECMCDKPEGYAILPPGTSMDCGALLPDAAVESGLPEASLPEAAPSEAAIGDAPADAGRDASDAANTSDASDAHGDVLDAPADG
jgi:hypothetical protein